MLISSTGNPLVKRLRGLAERANREAEGRMVIEGVRLIEEAVAARIPFELLLYDSRAQDREPRLAALVAEAAQRGIRTLQASAHVIAACSQVETPQGVLAVIETPHPDLGGVLEAPGLLLVVADRVQDPGNLGTIVRVADAASASGVVATRGSVDRHNPKTVRASMGSVFHLPVLEADGRALLDELRRRGIRILVADRHGAVEYTAASYRRPLALVVGSEAGGADRVWREAAETTVCIPIYGRAESLNVAIAAALLLYEARRIREG